MISVIAAIHRTPRPTDATWVRAVSVTIRRPMAGPRPTRQHFAWVSVTRNTVAGNGWAAPIVIITPPAFRKRDRSARPGRCYTFPAATTPAQTATTASERSEAISISKIAAAVIRDRVSGLEIKVDVSSSFQGRPIHEMTRSQDLCSVSFV